MPLLEADYRIDRFCPLLHWRGKVLMLYAYWIADLPRLRRILSPSFISRRRRSNSAWIPDFSGDVSWYEQEQYFFTSYSYNKRMRALGALTGV